METVDKYSYLLEIAKNLRKIVNSENLENNVLENIENAIVYLDCARYNLEFGSKYKVAMQVVIKAKE